MDLISRQAAIDAVETKIKKWNAVDGEGYHVGLGLRYTDVIDTLTELPSAQPIQTASNYLQSLPTSPLLVGKMPSAQPDRSLWFRIGEVCVGESKGDISAEMAVEKIRELLREAERREG